MKEEDNMTKEVIWGVLVLALISTTYLSHVEDRRHKEAMAKLEGRKLELQERMREADKEIELGELKMAKANEDYERKLAELDKAHAERKALESRAETPAESREALRRVHATNDRVERGNR